VAFRVQCHFALRLELFLFLAILDNGSGKASL
jgi:hypothetical protein